MPSPIFPLINLPENCSLTSLLPHRLGRYGLTAIGRITSLTTIGSLKPELASKLRVTLKKPGIERIRMTLEETMPF